MKKLTCCVLLILSGFVGLTLVFLVFKKEQDSENGPAVEADSSKADSHEVQESILSSKREIDLALATLEAKRLNWMRSGGLVTEATRARRVAGAKQLESEKQALVVQKAKLLGLPLVAANGGHLQGFDGDRPIYWVPYNVNAAISTAATQIRDVAPYDVDGADIVIGLWEAGGIPRATHDEFGGQVILKDSSSTSDHATHVSGTLIGNGSVNSSAKGMAPAATIHAYDTGSLISEMMAELAVAEGTTSKVYLTNNSWGQARGWRISGSSSSPVYNWHGTFSDDGDASNDFIQDNSAYTSSSQVFDDVVVDFPYAALFFSAGNDRGENAPPNGTSWNLDGNTSNSFVYDSASHPRSDSLWMTDDGITGYGTMSDIGAAKNVIAVGSINDAVSGGNRSLVNATLSFFSSCGPTDDGRIKPDLVGNGELLLSAIGSSDTAVANFRGTSMSCPNVTGTAALLIDYYDDLYPGESMRASMLKALLIHTADDLGNAGPDYRYGWGLVNAKAAADLLQDDAASNTSSRILDGRITNADVSDTFVITHDGAEDLRLTLVWTDPFGSSASNHDDRAPKLVNDLNISVTKPDSTTALPYVMPWVGDWSDDKLNDLAVTGVNTVDNVEQVYLSAAAAGEYIVTIDHMPGAILSDQIYTLVVSGAGGKFEAEKPALLNDPGTVILLETAGASIVANAGIMFSSALDTTYTVGSSDEAVFTVSVNATDDITVMPVGVGSAVVTVTATNEFGDSSAHPFILQVLEETDLTEWRVANGLALDGSEDHEDASGNGVSNFLYYAFGLGAPTQFNVVTADPAMGAAGLPSTEIAADGQSFVMTYVRRVGSVGAISYRIQSSSDLGSNWTTMSALPTETVTPLNAEYEFVSLEFAIGGTDLFYRMAIQDTTSMP